MNPSESQWNVVHLSEHRAKKEFPTDTSVKGYVPSEEDPAMKKHFDEAIALGNSWRTPK